jgi:hypothetical protein
MRKILFCFISYSWLIASVYANTITSLINLSFNSSLPYGTVQSLVIAHSNNTESSEYVVTDGVTESALSITNCEPSSCNINVATNDQWPSSVTVTQPVYQWMIGSSPMVNSATWNYLFADVPELTWLWSQNPMLNGNAFSALPYYFVAIVDLTLLTPEQPDTCKDVPIVLYGDVSGNNQFNPIIHLPYQTVSIAPSVMILSNDGGRGGMQFTASSVANTAASLQCGANYYTVTTSSGNSANSVYHYSVSVQQESN